MRQVNRRESHRVEVKLRCYVISPPIWTRGAMYVENMSRNGLLLAWRSETGPVHPPAVGQFVTVEVELPSNHCFGPKCIHCQGTVARVSLEDRECPRVAVQLNHMDFRSFTDRAAAQLAPELTVISWTA